ncbi:MAG: SAM-dependent methyltransferase, partial [Burkholderiales bacterium]|nr:SAM-dependent methyltransferase [Burkholderiales bacterium]
MQPLLDAIARVGVADADADAQRVFHGRGGLHPGCEHLALDIYPPVWLLT